MLPDAVIAFVMDLDSRDASLEEGVREAEALAEQLLVAAEDRLYARWETDGTQ